MCTPAIRALRGYFPKARITSFAGESALQVLKGNPNIDEFIESPGRVNMNYLVRLKGLIKSFRSKDFDLSIVLHGNDPEAVPIACLSGARFRLSMTGSVFSEHLTWYFPSTSASHVIDEKLAALAPLGISAKDRRMEMCLSDDEEAEAGRILKERGFTGPLVCIHPFGSKPTRNWEIEKTARLADSLHDSLGLDIVILGGTKERELEGSMRIASLMNNDALLTAGEIGLRTSAAIIKRSSVAVSTDSGPMHIAEAFNIPLVAILGSTLAISTGPINKESIILQSLSACDEPRPCKLYKCDHISCMNSIDVDEVFDAVRRVYRVSK
jgi:heptosyltransferase-2